MSIWYLFGAFCRSFVLCFKIIGKSILNKKDILLSNYHLIMMKVSMIRARPNPVFIFRHAKMLRYRVYLIEGRLNEMDEYYSEMQRIYDMLNEEFNKYNR